MRETDISQIVGITRPEINSLSKADLINTFEKYLNYLDELVEANIFYVEKARKLENRVRKFEEQLIRLKRDEQGL